MGDDRFACDAWEELSRYVSGTSRFAWHCGMPVCIKMRIEDTGQQGAKGARVVRRENGQSLAEDRLWQEPSRRLPLQVHAQGATLT